MKEKNTAKTYTVTRLDGEMKIDADWDKPQWQGAKPVTLEYYMGEKPQHFPHTQAKLMYDDANLYVIFKVDDQYVKAVQGSYQNEVCQDSCVEFFFTPGADIAEGYFNVEMNCAGTPLLRYQKRRDVERVDLGDEDLDKIEIAHSMHGLVPEEITEPVTWTLEYRLPLEILGKYASVTKPQSGVVWKANLYKCGDQTSHPHWLTWSLVDLPTPDFHRPEFFGELVFE